MSYINLGDKVTRLVILKCLISIKFFFRNSGTIDIFEIYDY